MSWIKTTSGKYLLKGVGRVYNCNCNRRRKDGYHNVNCASRKNLTLTYELSLWERLKRISAPKSNVGEESK